MKLLPVIGMCSFLFATSPVYTVVGQTYIGQEKIEVTTLPLYRVLTVVQDTIQKMHNDSSGNDVFAGADEVIKQALVLLTSCVDAINNNVLYEFGDIRDRFMAMAMCVGDFGAMPEPYILREFRRVIREFDTYVTTFMVSRAAFLSPQAKNTFESMMSLNQLLLEKVLNDEHFSWGFLDYLDDYVISRPLEFVQEHPILVSSIVLVIIASILYCYWEKAPEQLKDEVKNYEKKDEKNNAQKNLSKEESEKKPDYKKMHEELKPVVEDIKKAIKKELDEKNLSFISAIECDVLLPKIPTLRGLSLDSQEFLYKTVTNDDFYLPGRKVSLEKVTKFFADKLESLEKK